MNSRERVIASIEFTGPDRLPHRHGYIPAAFYKYPQIADLYRKYPSDFAGENPPDPETFVTPRLYRKGQWLDEWGCLWTALADGLLGQVTSHPLLDLDKLKDYRWPQPNEFRLDGELWLAENRGDRYLLFGWTTLFERMVDLRGFEQVMIDLVEGEDGIFEIRDQILAFNLGMIERWLTLKPDGIFMADDWGSQLSLMISPKLWREAFLPAYRKLFGLVRDAGCHGFFHTDGYTMDILPDMVDAGVNVFWADMTVNPLTELRAKLGGKVCFQALTDVQFTLNHATPKEVTAYGKRMIDALATFNGGLIASSELYPDHPYENIEAMLECFFRYGKYPELTKAD